MPSNDYHFITHWRVEGTVQEVSDIIGNAPDLVRWWPSVYLDVLEIQPGDESGVGKVVELYTKGWLPYTLRWRFRVTESRPPHGFTLQAFGDFVGRGIWTFEQDGRWANVTYDWRVRADKALLRRFSFLIKPVFEANHRWAMSNGEESLRLELARRYAPTPVARARVPAPPGPTFPHKAKSLSPMRTFDPAKVGYYEKENWVAYYNKDWPRLARVSVRMVKEAFGLSTVQAAYAAYLVGRAEIAFAFPNNDIPKAEGYMRRFYEFIKRVHREAIDVELVARLEVNWWVVHRRLFGNPDNEELVDALTHLYAAAYQVEPENVREAAYYRAQAMLYSDRWVNEGRVKHGPLLVQEEDALVESYRALKEAVQVAPRAAVAA